MGKKDKAEIKLYMPKNVVDTVYVNGKIHVDNASLLFNKYVLFEKSQESQKYSEKPNVKMAYEQLANILIDIKKYTECFNSIKEIKLPGIEIKDFSLTTKTRLVVGLGSESAYEVSIHLDRNYGVPIIPGSALKGIAKYYSKKILGWDENKIKSLFGDQDNEGTVIFFDAYPYPESIFDRKEGKLKLDLDIMNPHYGHYYQGDQPPGDWGSPTPIFFITVKPGVKYLFRLGFKAGVNDDILNLCKEALKGYGVGAKTSLGYGLFK